MPAPLLTFYGDDFTGSSAVMEVLSFAGIPTVLFMDVPDRDFLRSFPEAQVVGVAGVARSKDPAWMREHLPPVFEGLKRLGAPLTHYKVCSTFDSAPEVGSIGVAAEIGKSTFDPDWIPLVVGAPAIGRYQVFGTLFAAAGEGVHRLDRHPVMARHPVTPMNEADLGQHLSLQTDLKTGVVDFRAMTTGSAEAALGGAMEDGAVIVALDAMDDVTLEEAGRLIFEGKTGFAIGSQGVEYALVAYWAAMGKLEPDPRPPRLAPVDQLFAVSGSCAPTTAQQIACAEASGFEILDFDAAQAAGADTLQQEVERVRQRALTHFSDGRDVLVTSARGPDDPALGRMAEAIARADIRASDANERLGRALGTLVAQVRETTGLKRAAIGGGDTSGHALTEVQAEALTAVAPLAAGAPLCQVHTRKAPKIDGLEVTLKGGQMGAPDFFIHAKSGDA